MASNISSRYLQDPINADASEIKDMVSLTGAGSLFTCFHVKKDVSDASLKAYELHRRIQREEESYVIIDGIRKKYSRRIYRQYKRMNETYKYAEPAFTAQKFEIKYNERKSENDQADLVDIEHYAIKILKTKTRRMSTRHNDYIFIDEYQDSNLCRRDHDSIRRITTSSW